MRVSGNGVGVGERDEGICDTSIEFAGRCEFCHALLLKCMILRSICMFAYSSQPSVQLRSLLKAKMPHKENNISVPFV